MTNKYKVIILQDNDIAVLDCDTLSEAEQVKQSFINYGKCDSVKIMVLEKQY